MGANRILDLVEGIRRLVPEILAEWNTSSSEKRVCRDAFSAALVDP